MDKNPLDPQVLYEDKNIVVLNKPAGILVHGIFDKNGPKHNEETITDWLAKHYPETQKVGDKPEQRGGIVHRLDRETSGVLVIARTEKAFAYLKKLLQGRAVKKIYLALVWGRIHEKKGVIDKPISIVNGTVKRTVFKGKMPRESVTEYEVVSHYLYRHGKQREEMTLVKVMPKTGRTHQIRVHFSAIGHELAGDKLYGKKKPLFFEEGSAIPELNRQFLHAQKIEFTGLDKKKVSVSAELPAELVAVLDQLDKND